MAKAMKSSSQVTQKWLRNLSAAGETVREGVDAVEVAPGVLAARQQDAMKTNLLKSIDSGKWARRVAAVSREEWQDKMKSLGIPRMAAGANAAQGKMQHAMDQILPHIQQGVSKLEKMPSVTLEDNIQRMTSFVRHMATLEVER